MHYEVIYSDQFGMKREEVLEQRKENDREAIKKYNKLRMENQRCTDWKLLKTDRNGHITLIAANEA